jgi:HSP20 family molecular chaperone IbpA
MANPFQSEVCLWDEALAMLDEAERRHRHFFRLLGAYSRTPAWEPPADVFETADALSIAVALPGVSARLVSVSIEDPDLVIRAERAPPRAIETVRVRRLEIPYGSFERRLTLPAGRYTLQQQRLVDGVLELLLVPSR